MQVSGAWDAGRVFPVWTLHQLPYPRFNAPPVSPASALVRVATAGRLTRDVSMPGPGGDIALSLRHGPVCRVPEGANFGENPPIRVYMTT